MKNYRLLLVCAATAALASANANATSVTLSGIANWASANTSAGYFTNVTTGSLMGWGGGLDLNLDLVSVLSLDLGADYVQRGFSINGSSQTFTANYIEVPLQLKLTFGGFMVGAGGYVASGMGTPSGTGANGGSVNYSGFGDAGITNLDYGFIGSVGYDLSVAPGFGIVVQGRYLLGLDNVTTLPAASNASYQWNDIQAMLGIRIGSAGGLTSGF